MLSRSYAMSKFTPRTVVHKYGERELTIHLTDPLSQGWYDMDWAEPAEITLLRKHQLRAGATVFDLGAHTGVVALILADAVGKTGKVIALEANPEYADVARRNRDTNGAEQIIVEAAAISDTIGEISFACLNGQVGAGGDTTGQIRVPALTVDALAEKHGAPAVLFIDVEGFELQALRGAKKTLAARPDCFVEMHVGVGLEEFGGSVRQVTDLFGAGYDLFMSNEAVPTPIPFRADDAMTRARFFLTAVARSS